MAVHPLGAILVLIGGLLFTPGIRGGPQAADGAASGEQPDSVKRNKTVSEWVKGGAESVPELIKALDDADKNVRANAALALGSIGKASAKAVPALVRLLSDRKQDDKVRLNACYALQRIGAVPAAEAAIPSILEVIADQRNSYTVRERSVSALRVHHQKFGENPAILKGLTGLLSEPKNQQSRMLRYDAAYLLGMIWGPKAPAKTLDVLLDYLKDDTIEIYLTTNKPADGRIMAVDALLRMGPKVVSARPGVLMHLRQLAASRDQLLRDRAKKALGELSKE
jgi:HEAT repeat protein